MAIKRDIASYGILSVKEERIEYIGSTTDASFILFDASHSQGTKAGAKDDQSVEAPVIEKSELSSIKPRKSRFHGQLLE